MDTVTATALPSLLQKQIKLFATTIYVQRLQYDIADCSICGGISRMTLTSPQGYRSDEDAQHVPDHADYTGPTRKPWEKSGWIGKIIALKYLHHDVGIDDLSEVWSRLR